MNSALPHSSPPNPAGPDPALATPAPAIQAAPTPAPPVPAASSLSLPPFGPAWFSSVMGTGILSNLLGQRVGAHPWLLAPAAFLLVTGFALTAVYTAGYVRHRRSAARELPSERTLVPPVDPAWGTVSMGLLSIGSALLTVGPLLGLPHGVAVALDSFLWWLGTGIGIVTNLMFLARTLVKQGGTPVPPWGLAVVSPMVSATAGAVLLMHFTNPALQFVVLTLSFACFVIALATGAVIFTVTYLTHVKVSTLPTAIAISSWIPLGVVGQSAAAAVAIAVASRLFLTPDATPLAHATAAVYGLVMIAVAVPVVALATRLTIRGFHARMPFNPGWWALTFPIGTLALGGHLLDGLLREASFPAGFLADAFRTLAPVAAFAGDASLLALCCTWTFCTVSSVRAVAAVRAHR